MSDQLAAWRAAGVQVEWVGPPASPLRLNLTLSLPDRHNPQTPALWGVLREIRRAVPGSVRVVVLRGDGPSLSSGLDTRRLSRLLDSPPAEVELDGYQRAFDWTSDPGFISVAAVHGYALGAGLQLALGCDLRIVTADAVLGLPEVTHGLVPDLGTTSQLVKSLGYARALDLAVTGRRVSGREAFQLGLAQRVVEPDQLDDEVERMVAELLAPGRDVVREIKALLLGAENRTRDDQRAAERQAQLRRFADLAADKPRDTSARETSARETSAPGGALPG